MGVAQGTTDRTLGVSAHCLSKVIMMMHGNLLEELGISVSDVVLGMALGHSSRKNIVP